MKEQLIPERAIKNYKQKTSGSIRFKLGIHDLLNEKLADYPDEDHQQIAYKLIEDGRSNDVAGNLDNFKRVDKKGIIERIFKAGYGEAALANIEIKDFDRYGIDVKKLLVDSIVDENNLFVIPRLADYFWGKEEVYSVANRFVDIIGGIREIEECGKINRGEFGSPHLNKKSYYTSKNKEKIKNKLLELIGSKK